MDLEETMNKIKLEETYIENLKSLYGVRKR